MLETILYNRIVIVGNGFDLSQGLKSSYKDFLLDYFKSVFDSVWKTKYYSDEFISIEIDDLSNGWYAKIIEYNKIDDYVNDYNLKSKIVYNSQLFKELVTSELNNWIDIERFYFRKLKQCGIEYERDGNYRRVKVLNDFIDNISNKLNDYLFKIQNEFSYSQTELGNTYLDFCYELLNTKELNHIYRKEKLDINQLRLGKVFFLNFNYTNILFKLINKIVRSERVESTLINIHGTVYARKSNTLDLKNNLILGYGDDTSDDYKNLELKDEVDFLKHIKSSKYSRTRDYHTTLNFLDERNFDVFIVGHSCGLSDKTLLKTIFEHENCLAIKVFHRGNYESFLNKNISISRHFSDKYKMRDKVLPFDENAIVIQRILKK